MIVNSNSEMSAFVSEQPTEKTWKLQKGVEKKTEAQLKGV